MVELVRAIIDRGDGKRRGQMSYAADHALARTRRLFNWAIAQEIYEIEMSPRDAWLLHKKIKYEFSFGHKHRPLPNSFTVPSETSGAA
jgi:hypothetical protein